MKTLTVASKAVSLIPRRIALLVCWSAVFLSPVNALAGEATEAETTWFVGEWAVAPAPVEGFETIVAKKYSNVHIERPDQHAVEWRHG